MFAAIAKLSVARVSFASFARIRVISSARVDFLVSPAFVNFGNIGVIQWPVLQG